MKNIKVIIKYKYKLFDKLLYEFRGELGNELWNKFYWGELQIKSLNELFDELQNNLQISLNRNLVWLIEDNLENKK